MMVAIIIKGFERAKQLQSESKHRMIKVPFVHDAFTEFAYTILLRAKYVLGWVNVPVEHCNTTAVHLLADPKAASHGGRGYVRASGKSRQQTI